MEEGKGRCARSSISGCMQGLREGWGDMQECEGVYERHWVDQGGCTRIWVGEVVKGYSRIQEVCERYRTGLVYSMCHAGPKGYKSMCNRCWAGWGGCTRVCRDVKEDVVR